MTTKQRNFKIPGNLYDELQATATRWNTTVTDLIVSGAKKELVWRKLRNELGQPQTLIFDKELGHYQPESEYREKFFAELSNRLPIM